MFEKEFLSLDLTKKVRELGFDEPCLGYWSIPLQSEDEPTIYIGEGGVNTPVDRMYIPAPLIQQVIRWFISKNYLLYVESFADGSFDYTIISNKFKEEFEYDDGPSDTYEEAQISGIKRMIEELEDERG